MDSIGEDIFGGGSTVAPWLARVFLSHPQGAPHCPQAGCDLGSQLAVWGFLYVHVVGTAG
eukprot:540663-Rhodomonas_salina.1